MGRKSPNEDELAVDNQSNEEIIGDEMKSMTMSMTATDGDVYNQKVRDIGENLLKNTAPSIDPRVSDSFPIDPYCDPANPKPIQFSEISAAAYNIRDGIEHTPCTRSNQLSNVFGVHLYFKKEFLQVTGSFKERGARYALLKLTEKQRTAGVIAASQGNHALALAYHGQQLNIPVTVVMPVYAPLMKISMCRTYNANVIVKGENVGEAKEFAMRMGVEQDIKYINGFDNPDILAGQGTIGLEILEQVNNVDAVLIPVGGGGMIAGVALAIKTLKPSTLVIGVESDTCPSFQRALSENQHAKTPAGSTLADGLAVPVVGANSWATARDRVDKMVAVSEGNIALAILRLLEFEKAVVEGAGAVGLAALIGGQLDELKGKRVVCILSGGNIDTTVLGRTIERGLATDGRLIQFTVVVSDRPGGIAELAALIAQCGAGIKDIFHERAWVRTDIYSVSVKIVAETRDRAHVRSLESMLRARYAEVHFSD